MILLWKYTANNFTEKESIENDFTTKIHWKIFHCNNTVGNDFIIKCIEDGIIKKYIENDFTLEIYWTLFYQKNE